MSIRMAVLISAVTVWIAACSPHLPPTNVPAPPDPQLQPFQQALQTYVDETQPYRKQAAQAAERVPAQKTTANAETSVRTRQDILAQAVQTKLRPSAKQGDVIGPAAAAVIRRDVADAFNSPRKDLLMDAIAEQNELGAASSPAEPPRINQPTDAPRVPPILVELLPRLPQQLEYAFVGRTLVLRDADSDTVVDYLPDTIPVPPPPGPPAVAPVRVSNGAGPLPMPSLRGSIVFALMGDSGSGDAPQEQVAAAMVKYFTDDRHFPFVLMLGDNLYDDDYTGEFLTPYKPLLDRGVTFFAALGNHDRDLEIHFKPFNMQDRSYYSFERGNARFVALNSNRPADPAQLKWFETAFDGAGDKWRIAFFHHPLYSSGQHAAESRDVIRPALEGALVRNHVNVVFSGHEHLYERIAPQKGIHYFVSGGGGRYLYDYRPSDFDEVGVSEHHFMVVEIAGDRLFFEAVTPEEKLLDCGVIWRTPEAAAKVDNDTRTWLAACDAGRPRLTH